MPKYRLSPGPLTRLGSALVLFFAMTAAVAAPKVAVSVLPVHSLVWALMQGVGPPQLLMQGGQSPHDSSLKPSQLRAIDDADLIVWIGPSFEHAMAKPIAAKKGEARVMTLLDNENMRRLKTRPSGIWNQPAGGAYVTHTDSHDSHEHGAAQNSATKNHAPADPHLWLSIHNADAIARQVARQLQRIDPANHARYEHNLQALIVDLADFKAASVNRFQRIAQRYAHGKNGAPYVVFHDAYQYFEHEFGVRPAAALTAAAEHKPGARRVSAIKKLIQTGPIDCVFSEPQFSPALVEVLLGDSAAAAAVLDPLGASLRPGPAAWFQLMDGILTPLIACLE